MVVADVASGLWWAVSSLATLAPPWGALTLTWVTAAVLFRFLPERRQDVIRGGAGDLPVCEHYHVHITNVRVAVHATVHVHHEPSRWASIERDRPAVLPAGPRALEPARGMVVDGHLVGQPAERMAR